MNLYEITYTNNNIEGTATVAGSSAREAAVILQSTGRNNGTRYQCTSIREVGCTEYPKGVISEYYAGINNNLDINNISDEDIKKLKLRIDKYSKILYVDRIGTCLRPKAHVGYTVFTLPGAHSIEIPNPNYYSLYVKTESGYKCLGIPQEYNKICSPRCEITISYDGVECSILDKKYICPPKLGIFVLLGSNRNDPVTNNWKPIHKNRKYSCLEILNTRNPAMGTWIMKDRINSRFYIKSLKDAKKLSRGTLRISKNTPNEYIIFNVIYVLGYIKRGKPVRIKLDNGESKKEVMIRLKGLPLKTIKVTYKDVSLE